MIALGVIRKAHGVRGEASVEAWTDSVERFTELDTERYGELFRGLLERGIYVAPSQYECLFPSLAHGDDEIDATINAVGDVLS